MVRRSRATTVVGNPEATAAVPSSFTAKAPFAQAALTLSALVLAPRSIHELSEREAFQEAIDDASSGARRSDIRAEIQVMGADSLDGWVGFR